jgi:hypothetical protein
MESAEIPKTIRLMMHIAFRLSRRNVDNDIPCVNKSADKPYMQVSQMPVKEGAKHNFAAVYVYRDNKDASTAPCRESCNILV